MSSPPQITPQPAETQAKGILLVRELCKSFSDKNKPEVKALDSVSFVVHRGCITGLVGADGAGKTTLIRISAGLLVPTSGSVTVLGRDSIADTLEIQSRVGYMPQKFGLYQDLTVAENMTLYADLQGVAGTERTEKFTRLLQMTSLGAYTGRRAGALSGGMKQKLGLACALIKSPEILLLDEPTVGVDPVSRRELWKIVNELVERDGIGVLVSTAYLDEAEKCDQVVVLHEGKVLAEGTADAFIKPMAGRTLLLDASPDRNLRTIYTHLSGRADVVDVTIRSGKVRTVLAEKVDATTLTDTLGPITTHQAQPTFEDAFMALIPRSDHQHRPSSVGSTHPGHDQDEIVRADNLQKLFGTFEAVKKLTFTVRRGEIFGLLGPNGAGKSTTFRILCGLLPASGGEISVAGHDLRRSRARARSRLGYMAQQFSLYGQLTTRENLGFFGKAYGLSGKRLKTRIEWAFAEFSLAKWADTPAGALPGGNKQRLAMAVALLHEPDILFLDEPTSGVDPFARREFWLRINTFAEQGTTVVVTTHFMEEAEYCDRMLIMSQGDTLAFGTPTEIRELAKTADTPHPTMDDAFIALAEGTVITPQSAPATPMGEGKRP
ncbi:ATP-binding cassette domain-containing protein [Desulfofustis glycolicus]|uniref:ABC-2 type transport system ATP-binding protein n=1 Tax=Desulfofustis glycolicus DSM 9705 TaxID=1121409 RepID=A0A1M5WZY2_9BACT|nr:ATP-binding cassette domain-containing protein [Desulfofustis glycolicus]SHH93091.1 ABC-2 type transport system ATP-binding protein [Desulfofustis glycolicus DSM 9705]